MAGETLNVVAGNAAGSAIPLEQELVIGRSTPGLGSLGGDSEISRVHARVYHDAQGQLIAEDATAVGQVIPPAAAVPPAAAAATPPTQPLPPAQPPPQPPQYGQQPGYA